ncbi:MAG TPA: AbrB/MazE/SpoVT family DNA-binding domain-containing protein [Thermoanaerobaculia bacterium]|nr:AbrB/MazE/SpoVT family DNA-binding domain-containing protein [Thermoanaerobaculia bacterium]
MSKVTSKLQVTLPKALAERYGIRPGDEITWKPSAEALRVELPGREETSSLTREQKLALFDESWKRQLKRQARRPRSRPPRTRGWTREELYGDRGRPR